MALQRRLAHSTTSAQICKPIYISPLCRRYHPSRTNTDAKPSISSSAALPKPAQDGPDMELSSLSTPGPSKAQIEGFDPIAQARARTQPLPRSRFQFRPTKYDRGPLHPNQHPPPSDPASRIFIPGPFSLPRLRQTYTSTLQADLMTLFYQHVPLGTPKKITTERLRSWNPEDSPYYANRPLRAPRAAASLPLLRKPITFRNVPEICKVTVSSIIPQANENSAWLHVAGMVVQAITGVRAQVYRAKQSLTAGQRARFTQRAGRPIAVGASLEGEYMWHFLSTVIDRVLPRIKDWKGIKGSSGDDSGNIGFGLWPEIVEGWPEIEVNYDAYPPQMIPGVFIIVHTTATNDRDARLLLASFGFPFDGRHGRKA